MRQALEKLSSGAAPSRSSGFPSGQIGAKAARHRYVQDGEVVVEHATGTRGRGAGIGPAQGNGPELRFAELQAALATERAAREQAERGQERALSTARALETRLKHTEVALREALYQAGAREAELAAARAELREHAERQAAALAAVPATPVPVEEATDGDGDEPEPVKWWLTSKPAVKRAPRRSKQAAPLTE